MFSPVYIPGNYHPQELYIVTRKDLHSINEDIGVFRELPPTYHHEGSFFSRQYKAIIVKEVNQYIHLFLKINIISVRINFSAPISFPESKIVCKLTNMDIF